jgi:hypothetical protein
MLVFKQAIKEKFPEEKIYIPTLMEEVPLY